MIGQLEFFNRCESTSPYSVMGPNLVAIGTPTLVAGKWGNAVNSPSNSNGLTSSPNTFSNTIINNWNRFTVEMFINVTYNVSSGVPQSGGNYNSVFSWHTAADAYMNFILAFQSNGTVFDINGTYWLSTDSRINITANTTTHIAFVVNTAGIAGSGDTGRFYINNVLSGTTSTAFPGYSSPVIMHFLDDYPNYYSLQGWEDNIKIWATDLTDFRDSMNNERAGMPDWYGLNRRNI